MDNDQQYLGNQQLLGLYKTAFFCSNKCPGDVIIKAQELAYDLSKKNVCVISGFHTPVEKEVLRVLLKGQSPVIICPARGLYKKIPQEHKKAFDENRILYVTSFGDSYRRMTAELAEKRNRHIVELADEIIFGYASPGGMTERVKEYAKSSNKTIIEI